MNKKELWLNLKTYHFNHIVPPNLWNHVTSMFIGEDASEQAFADKIGRKHGWKNSFTIRAVHEYKKFIYLGVTSNFHVTPSKIIDIVWHEHLLFTKAYRDFCTEVIQFNFEHHPELIPIDEQTVQFAIQYVQTLQLYRKEFGIDAPIDIWSLPKFNSEQLVLIQQLYKRKQTREVKNNYTDTGLYNNDTEAPLVTMFDTDDLPEFGGGDFGGAGAGSDFSSEDSGASSDSSDSGSGCSSGCGGGCGGGD